MVELKKAYNTDDNKEKLNDFSVIPPGEYTAEIIKSEMKQNQNKTGYYLALRWKIIKGDHKGKLLFNNLNLVHPNPVASQIADKALNSICAACNKLGVKDSEQLHGIPVVLVVALKKATETRPASNDIKGYIEYKPSTTMNRPPEATSGASSEATSENSEADFWDKQ